jgi:hypothetical protein
VSLSGAMNSRLVPFRSPWFTRRDLPRIPSPTTQHALSSLYRCPSSATDAHVQHFMGQASPCMRRLAAPQGRIVFVILRTACSPPVALHPASQQRSYLRLPKSGIISEEDFHLLNRACSQAHSFRRKRESSDVRQFWTPAFAGVTECRTCYESSNFVERENALNS